MWVEVEVAGGGWSGEWRWGEVDGVVGGGGLSGRLSATPEWWVEVEVGGVVGAAGARRPVPPAGSTVQTAFLGKHCTPPPKGLTTYTLFGQ